MQHLPLVKWLEQGLCEEPQGHLQDLEGATQQEQQPTRSHSDSVALSTVLAKLKDSDVPVLEWGSEAKAKSYEVWVQRVAIKVSGWHPDIEKYWQIVQLAAAEAYEQYLYLGPMQRAMVRPDVSRVPANLHTIELRMRSMLLDAIPAGVRKAALNTMQTSVSELLFAVMVEAGPGTAKDRDATLKAVSQAGVSAMRDVYDNLQKWKFDLTRLMRLGMAPPDPTVQAETLRRMVQRMAENDTAFQYRLHAFQMQNGMFGMLTQTQVDEFWRYLSSEAREFQHVQQPPPPPPGAKALKGDPSKGKGAEKGDPGGKAKGKGKKDPGGKSKGQPSGAEVVSK